MGFFFVFYPGRSIILYMAKAKKTVIETHGKVEEEKFQPTLLEQVWGRTDLSRYSELSEDAYNESLRNMTRADIEAHARKMGVVVVENTARLKDKLLTEYRSYVSMMRKPADGPKSSGKMSDAAMKVLAEGR